MTPEQLRALRPGDIVRHATGSDVYVVTANYGDRVTAVRTVDMTNPVEWLIIPDGRAKASVAEAEG